MNKDSKFHKFSLSDQPINGELSGKGILVNVRLFYFHLHDLRYNYCSTAQLKSMKNDQL